MKRYYITQKLKNILYKGIVVLLTLIVGLTQPALLLHAQESSSSSSLITPIESEIQSSPTATEATSSSTFLPDIETATKSGTLVTNLPQLPVIRRNLSPENPNAFSARIKRATKVRNLKKKIFRSNETIQFTVENPQPNQKVSVTNSHGEPVTIPIYRTGNADSVEIVIPPPQRFTPGTFTITVTQDNTILSSQDFSWGVLAINPDQSVYKTLSRARFAMTVLNDFGETICTAGISLTITSPTGEISTYTTDNGLITKDDQCGSLAPDAPDDYVALFQIGESEGTYQLELTATTDAGPKTIQDNFKVSNNESFYIKRHGPTRIYPPNWYEMSIEVTASDTFTGTITETLPHSFTIQPGTRGQSFSSQAIEPNRLSQERNLVSLQMPFANEPVILRGYADPIPEEVSSLYTDAGVSFLDGVDFALEEETPIFAADDGVIAKIDTIYGTTIIIQHEWGKSYYGYLLAVNATEGAFVHAGDIIGFSGKPQGSSQAYLHFTIKRNDANEANGAYGKIDPLPYISKETTIASNDIKVLQWNPNIGKGETITLSYQFKTPLISPQFYLAGPLRFYTETPQVKLTPSPVPEQQEVNTISTGSADPRLAQVFTETPVLLQAPAIDADVKAAFLNILSEATGASDIIATNSSVIQQSSPSTPTVKMTEDVLVDTHTSFGISPIYIEPRAFQIAADAVPTNLQVSTVELYAGQYSGNGTTGQNTNTNQTFSAINFNLAEENVTIRQVIIYFEAQVSAYSDRGDLTGWDLSFDACVESCTANAWSGSGQVTVSDSSILAEDESESVTVRLLANVASETTIAAYTGSGSNLEAQVGYRIEEASAVNSIAQAKAKLFVTYTYSPAPTSTNYTNTVRFPLESTQSGDQGTRRNVIAGGCTRNSTCPVFDYNVDLGESSSTAISSWFRTEYFNDSNGGTDIVQNVNIQGTDTDSSDVRLEAARGSAQGNGQSAYFSGVSGFATDTASQLEIYHSTGNIYSIGGEINYTYSAPLSSTTKTKTVSYPFGIISNGSTTTSQSDTTTIYMPETGVTIQKAWIRLYGSNANSGIYNIQVTTTVEGTSETAAVQYDINSGNDVPLTGFTLFHVIDSSYYDEIEQATATNGIDVTVETTANTTNLGGVTAELMITYQYTDDSTGYLSSAVILAGQQTANPTDIFTASGIDPYFPEQTGVLTMRAAGLDVSILMSDTDGNPPATTVDVDADFSSGSCTTTPILDMRTDTMNAFAFSIRDVASNISTNDATTYTVCIENDGDTIDTSYGGKMNALLYYTYQVDLPTLAQLMRHGKWFDNNGTKQAFVF